MAITYNRYKPIGNFDVNTVSELVRAVRGYGRVGQVTLDLSSVVIGVGSGCGANDMLIGKTVESYGRR